MSRTATASEQGFSIVEVLLVAIIIAILSTSLLGAFQSLSQTYALTRQLNEIYAVLSSCPEIDRALQFDSISGATNCFPNNVFQGEGLTASKISYTPTLTVLNTTALSTSDPLKGIPDSKVVDVSTTLPNDSSATWRVRLLVTRGGIGQQ